MSATKMRVKTLTISEAEKAARAGDSSLWVLNRTEPQMMPMISARVDGEDQVVVIPVSWAVFDLSTQANKEAILKSPSFRGFHTRGFIAIVDTESAEALLQSNELARKETHRAAQTVYKSSAISSDDSSGELEITPRNQPRRPTAEASSVSPRVQMLVSQVDRGDVEAEQAVNMLAMAVLSDDDKQHILTTSQSAFFRDWAANIETQD